MILALRTDKPEAEVGLYADDGQQLSYHQWLAERRLAKELLKVIHEQLVKAGADWPDISGVVVFKGPGSFTGLRIGLTIANSIAYGNGCAIVAEEGEGWQAKGLARVADGQNDHLALPHYGAEFKLTPPKK